MDEVLTWEEIERRFDGEWVLIDDPELTDEFEIVRGRVLYHGDIAEDAEAIARAHDLRRTAILFVGRPVPEGMIAIL